MLPSDDAGRSVPRVGFTGETHDRHRDRPVHVAHRVLVRMVERNKFPVQMLIRISHKSRFPNVANETPSASAIRWDTCGSKLSPFSARTMV